MEDFPKKILIIALILVFITIVLVALISGLVKQKEQERINEVSSKNLVTNYVVSEPCCNSDYIRYSNYKQNYENEIKGEYSYYDKKEQIKDFLGSYITKYIVSVSNKGNTGNYFTVTFNFKNQKGVEYSETITQYLKAGERKEFVYKDIQFERTEILSWNYDIKRN
jgi:ABC-type antimicrobial peptide transport system permease subunit